MMSPRNKTIARALFSSALALTLAAGPSVAQAQVTDAEAACRAGISKYMGKYVKALGKGVANCHKQRNKGTFSQSMDCNDPFVADTSGKASLALNSALTFMFSPTCTSVPSVLTEFGRCPAPFELIDDFGGPGIDNFGELNDCMAYHIRKIVEDAASHALGHPGPLTSAEAKCHGALAKGLFKVIDTIGKERSKCQKTMDKGGNPLDFFCEAADPKGKIGATQQKASISISSACNPTALASLTAGRSIPRGAPELDSCADDESGLTFCVPYEEAAGAGGGIASLTWELPGTCPSAGSYTIETTTNATDFDVGATGLVHDNDPLLGYGGARFEITCDADCASCGASSINPAPDACRCLGDASVQCAVNADCAGPGGPCQCFYGPPAPYSTSGVPSCVKTMIDGPLTGSLNPGTGDLSLSVPSRYFIYVGSNSQFAPCPQCISGQCDGGQRDGLPCSVDAVDPTFGAVSYDCPPALVNNVSGAGVISNLTYMTGTSSLPANLACDAPLGAFSCACSTCSLNNTIACNSNAECSAVGAGVCRTDGLHGGANRSPNNCSDLVCSPDSSGGPGEGTCLAGPVDTFCDGALKSNGDGILTCGSQVDCDDLDSICPGGDCGLCALSTNRDCFQYPIVAQGDPGEKIVGTGCIAPTTSFAVNAVVGWPGPFRIQQNLSTTLFCPDGITPFQQPGGSNCP